jgi:hypothetical protein
MRQSASSSKYDKIFTANNSAEHKMQVYLLLTTTRVYSFVYLQSNQINFNLINYTIVKFLHVVKIGVS